MSLSLHTRPRARSLFLECTFGSVYIAGTYHSILHRSHQFSKTCVSNCAHQPALLCSLAIMTSLMLPTCTLLPCLCQLVSGLKQSAASVRMYVDPYAADLEGEADTLY